MNIGKLYRVKKYYWMLYPSKDITTPNEVLLTHVASASRAAAYYSTYFNCNISYIFPNNIFVLLEQDGEFIKILTTNGEVGWIYLADFFKDDIEEINQ
jgi:hypothetical protein